MNIRIVFIISREAITILEHKINSEKYKKMYMKEKKYKILLKVLNTGYYKRRYSGDMRDFIALKIIHEYSICM